MLLDVLFIFLLPPYVDLRDPLHRLVIHLFKHFLVLLLYAHSVLDLVCQNGMLIGNVDLFLQPLFFIDQLAHTIFHHHFLYKMWLQITCRTSNFRCLTMSRSRNLPDAS